MFDVAGIGFLGVLVDLFTELLGAVGVDVNKAAVDMRQPERLHQRVAKLLADADVVVAEVADGREHHAVIIKYGVVALENRLVINGAGADRRRIVAVKRTAGVHHGGMVKHAVVAIDEGGVDRRVTGPFAASPVIDILLRHPEAVDAEGAAVERFAETYQALALGGVGREAGVGGRHAAIRSFDMEGDQRACGHPCRNVSRQKTGRARPHGHPVGDGLALHAIDKVRPREAVGIVQPRIDGDLFTGARQERLVDHVIDRGGGVGGAAVGLAG